MSEPESFAPGICRTGICLALLRKIQQQNAAEDKIKKELATLTDVSSTRIEGSFFSVAMTTPLAAAKIDIFQNYQRGKRECEMVVLSNQHPRILSRTEWYYSYLVPSNVQLITLEEFNVLW